MKLYRVIAIHVFTHKSYTLSRLYLPKTAAEALVSSKQEELGENFSVEMEEVFCEELEGICA